MAGRRRRSARDMVAEELEILPMMNLFVVLIPMLLLSAVFLEMSVIRMSLPGDDAPDSAAREGLGLSITIRDESWVVKGRRLATATIDRTVEGAGGELRSALADAGQRFPNERDVVVRSQATTRYEDIVTIMDVTRETGFPNVSLAGGER